MRARVLIAIAVLAMTASLGVRERRVERALDARAAVDRVDMGIRLHVVRKNQIDGDELFPGLPRMTLVDTIDLGGMVEIDRDGARLAGPSDNPVVWVASEQQAEIILHPDDISPWLLAEGSEGGGKTTAGAMWLAVQALADIGTNAETGITAPTGDRLGHVRKAIADTWPAHWYRYHRNDDLYTWHAGPRFQCVTATSRSAAGGSPIQGYTWVRALADELQDHFDKESDIQSRLRDPRAKGRDKRLCTVTMKDSADFRTFREKCRTAKPVEGEAVAQWGVRRLLGLQSPFIFDRAWRAKRAAGTMTEREWRRRVECRDVGPERQVYFTWRRSFDNDRPANLRPVDPRDADITAQVMAQWGSNIGLVIGHDPGNQKQVSVFLKAYRLHDQRRGDVRPRWLVVDEITSPESTVHAHAQQVLKRARERWNCNGLDRRGERPDPSAPQVLVRIDPHTRGESDSHPGSDVVNVWRALGMNAKAAAYRAGHTEPTTIKKRQRIDMVNTLLEQTAEVGTLRRLFVVLNDDGSIAAPMLVKAFESMEFNAAGKAEAERKDSDDMSHWPAALGYALWPNEKPRGGLVEEAA